MDHLVSAVAPRVERGGSDLAGVRGGGDVDLVVAGLGLREVHTGARAHFHLR